MGLLRALFGTANPPARPYVDEGLALTKRLITSLSLSGWSSGTPEYTEQEWRAIEHKWSDSQELVELGGPAMQRTLGGEALCDLAGADWANVCGWEIGGDCPGDWKIRVSTYLRAWAVSLDPDALLRMAQLLALAGYKPEAQEAARIVADRFAGYAPRFFAGAHDAQLVKNITERARDLMSEIAKPRLLLHGLNACDSTRAIWKMLFSPALDEHFGAGKSLEWTERLIANFAAGNQDAFSAQYNHLLPEVKAVLSGRPKFSMANPPWSMISLDMRIGLIPWVTPAFDRGLGILLKNGCALEKHFGDVLPLAFFLHGGPGDTRTSAFRVCAPTSAVRASAEHWLIRAYLNRPEQGVHASIGPDGAGRTFSVHHYRERDGAEKRVFFETTESFSREEEDFRDVLQG